MKYKRIICMMLVCVMSLFTVNSFAFVEDELNDEKIQFVTIDEEGNEITEDLVYIDSIAEAYENQKNMR